MKSVTFSNFVLTGKTNSKQLGRFGETYHADVDVTTVTGMLFWKKTVTETKSIYRRFGEFWRYADTGEFTPGSAIENLSSAYAARTGEDC